MALRGHGAWLGMLLAGAAGAAVADPLPRTAPVSGAVTAAKGGEDATLVPESRNRVVEVRQQLKAGDILRTNAAGTLAIVFADGTQIRLGRNSVLAVRAVAAGVPSALQLQQGSAWGRSPRGRSNLSVETPSATAAIRGTDWALTVTGEATALQVFSGAVDLTNPQGSLSVTEGQAARAALGQAPVRMVLADPVGREQILYFLRPEDGLQISRAANPALAAYVAAVKAGEAPAAPPVVASDPASYVAAGFSAAYAGDLQGALRIADDGLARHPQTPALQVLRARVALLLGDPGLAERAIAAALALDPREPAALALRAEVAARYRGQPYQAIVDANAAIAAAPDRPAGYAALADIQLERGAEKEALAAIRAAIERDPENPELHARHAQVLLAQNRVEEAKAAIDRAAALDPSRATVRAAFAQYLLETGRPAQSREEVMAASADNPGYARALVQLAELNYRLGDGAGARQQLDAADRLDRESPLTPVARTAIAIQDYQADDAIRGAREALARFQARGGVYTSLSENRFTGSYAAQAFRFAGLEEWARYYGDRVFDSYTASSYFDQALARTPDPAVTAPLEPFGFDPAIGKNIGQLSTFLQGLALDPLAVSYPKRRVRFFKEAFTEGSVNAALSRLNGDSRPQAFLTLDGLGHAPMPMAYNVFAGWRESGGGADAPFLRGWLGAEPGAYDNVAAFVDLDRTEKAHDFTGFGVWSHEFGDRDVLQAAVLLRRGDLQRVTGVHASYAKTIGRLDLEVGAETQKVRAPIFPVSAVRQSRGYLDARWQPTNRVILQGQLAAVDTDVGGADDSSADVRLGAAFEPKPGHWLRLAYLRETNGGAAFTLAPSQPVSLRPDVISPLLGRSEAVLVRWEGEWNARVFSAFEYQRQAFGSTELDRAKAAVNLWPGGDVGLSATYAWTDVRQGFAPFLPRHLVQGQLTWTHPARVRIELRQTWADGGVDLLGRTRGDSMVTDASLVWEPFDKDVELRVVVENLFEARRNLRPGAGRLVAASLGLRF